MIEKHPALERGRLLEAGTVILRIDPADYELAVARSQASLESAEAQLAELEVTEENLDVAGNRTPRRRPRANTPKLSARRTKSELTRSLAITRLP